MNNVTGGESASKMAKIKGTVMVITQHKIAQEREALKNIKQELQEIQKEHCVKSICLRM